MDQTLLRSYFATVYEFPTSAGTLRASLDGEIVQDLSALPELLTRRFAVLTAYNPRSMLLPRRVNEQRHFPGHVAWHRSHLQFPAHTHEFHIREIHVLDDLHEIAHNKVRTPPRGLCAEDEDGLPVLLDDAPLLGSKLRSESVHNTPSELAG